MAIWKNNETAGVLETGAPSYGILLIDNFVRKPRSRLRLDFYWGILVRLVMHLFWGEKYKDLWFYTLFYIFILYLYSS